MTRLLRATALTCAIGAVLSLAACGGDDIGDALNITSPQARLVNAVPGSPALQFYRNTELQTSAGTPVFEQSSKFFDTVSTTSTWSIRAADTGLQVGSTSVDVSGSTRYTFIAFPGAGTMDTLNWFSDPYDVSLTDDSARLRIVNGATNDGTFDVYITAPGASLASATPQMKSVAYQGVSPVSGENSYSFGKGDYEIRLTATGTKIPFFDAKFTAVANADLLMMTLANSATAGDVRIFEMPSDKDDLNTELQNTL